MGRARDETTRVRNWSRDLALRDGEAQKGSKQENDRVRFVDGGEQGQIQADDARVLGEVVKPGPGQACP